MSDLDEIRKRLDKLRDFNQEQNKQNVTDDQLAEKLRKLKGLDSSDGAPSRANQTTNYLVPTKFKSDVEATDDLFKQLCDEVVVDNKFNDRYNANSKGQDADRLMANLSSLPGDDFDASLSSNFVSRAYDRTDEQHRNVMSQEELEKELGLIKSKMRQFNYEYKDFSKDKNAAGKTNVKMKANDKLNDDPFSGIQTDSSDDEANYIDLVKKFVDEVKLETTDGATKAAGGASSKEGAVGQKEDAQPIEPEEEKLDFCYICSEDAVLVCIDCDRERFCLQCFKEFHEDLEYRKHRYAKFNPKK